jgi:type II secretion system protein J
MKLVWQTCVRSRRGNEAEGVDSVQGPPPHVGGYSERAFTLIELLIAVMVFAIVLASINAVFYGAIRLRNKAAESLEAALPIQQAAAIIQRDLASIVAPGGTLSGEFQTSTGSNSVTGQVSPDFYVSTGVIEDAGPWGEVQKVSDSLLDSTNGTAGKDLVRYVTRNLLPAAAQDIPAEQWLMSGVDKIAFLYFNGTDWRDSWDSSSEQTKLPRAIKVQIALASKEKVRALTAPVEIVVPILVQAATNQTTQASGGGG